MKKLFFLLTITIVMLSTSEQSGKGQKAIQLPDPVVQAKIMKIKFQHRQDSLLSVLNSHQEKRAGIKTPEASPAKKKEERLTRLR